MPLAWASVTGKMTRSLRSSSGRKITSTTSPLGLDVRLAILGTDARRAVGSTATLPSAPMVPDRNVSDEMCPSPTARRLRMNRQPSCGAPDWSGCRTMLGLNKRRRFERVLVKKIGSDQAALRLVQYGMRLQCLFHLCGARLEDLEQVPVTAFEVLEHFGELPRGGSGLEPKNPADDMVGPGLIGRVEVSGLSRRLEGSDDDPGRIWTQMQDLAVQELGLRQSGPLGSFAVRSRDLRDRSQVGMWASFGLS